MDAERLIEFAERLARVASVGGGPHALAHAIASELGVSVLVEDEHHNHLAAAGNAVALPASLREANGQAGLTLPIRAGEAEVGWLGAFGPAAAAQGHLLRLAASTMAVELVRAGSGPQSRRRSFWEKLAAGIDREPSIVREEAAACGVTLASHFISVVLELEPNATADERSQLRALGTSLVPGSDTEAVLLERDGTVTLLAPAARDVDAANLRTAATMLPRTALKRHVDLHFTGGVSTRRPVVEIAVTVNEAATALGIGRRIFGAGHVNAYEDLGVYPLLFEGADAAQLRAFSKRALEPLRAYDEKHQTELLRTLRVYFAAGENVKTASEELNVHRHTVFYRLRQISEISGRKLDSQHDQLTLRMAIAIDALTS